MKIKVPSNRLPNSQAYQSLIKMAHERLVGITIKQLMESGIVNTAYGRGLDFTTAASIEDSIHHYMNLVIRYLTQQYPYISLVKSGFEKPIRGGSSGVGIGVQFIFKDQDPIFQSLKTIRDIDDANGPGANNSEVVMFGVPKWLNRYIAKINALCIKNRVPGSISLSVNQYSSIPSGFSSSSKPSDRAYIRITIYFDPVFMRPNDANASWTSSYGKFGRGRNQFNSSVGYFCVMKSPQEEMGDTKRGMDGVISMPLYSLAFFAKDIAQIVKTLHRKAEYVPSVFAVKL